MLDLLPAIEAGAEGSPIYRQIASGLAAEIEAGALAPGERLAPVRQVAEVLGVNFNTVARAYRLLAERGMVVMRQGQGSFVRGQEAEGAGAGLPELVGSFLRRAARRGYSAQEVRWEFANGVRYWMQSGEPPEPGAG
jgi:GntR family transcriptional regulator